ncbi:sensor histidine kinase [Actinomycetota bacterium Odt1-20B]
MTELPRGRRAHAGPPADEHDEANAPLAGAAPLTGDPANTPTRAGRWRLRPRTVRAKIVCLLMVPIVSLLSLWAYATVSTAQDVARLQRLQRVETGIRTPIGTAVTALQAERTAAVAQATRPAPDRAERLRLTATRTDRAVAKLRLSDHDTVAAGAGLPAEATGRLETFVAEAARLRTLRTEVLDHRAGWDTAYGQYTKAIATAFGVDGSLTGIDDAERGSPARVLLEFSRSGEMLAREDAVLAGARLAGKLDGERLRRFTATADTRRTLTEAATADLQNPERGAWRAVERGSAYGDLRAVEDKVLVAAPGRKALDAAPATTWNAAYATVSDGRRGIEQDAAHSAADRADPLTRGVLTPAGAAVLLGLIAVAASLLISVRIGRGLVVELVSLRNSALEIARRKLPGAMRRLRAGEELDIRAEAPPGPPAEDETGQVSEALTTVHRAALRAAIERAELASGISGVFVNLARRSQVLVHRQLSLLDGMERRAEDPNELSDLFRLDHLTTRMRRHAESLIILSGAAPGRAWRKPVSLTNVVRAAVSEIEDYARVEVRHLPEAAIKGAAVADLTHLLAELVENAAQFSPPHTKVRVSGEPVGNGYALEVEDRGLGMGADALAGANRRIEQSEALDLFDSDQLGLFVVSRLANRHGIKVRLSTSPYGGTTAVILLPTPLLQTALPQQPTTPEHSHDAAAQHARVPGPATPPMNGHHPVPAPPPRPALAASAPAPEATPPGVTALRPHRDEPQRHKEQGPEPHRHQPHRDDASAPPDPAAPSRPTPPPPDAADPSEEPSSGELPRRVRQASLAPQLRTPPTRSAPQAAHPRADDERSPEQARDRMTAYRDGWARGGGRRPGIVGAVPDPAGPAPRSDSEGDPA